MRSIRFFLPLVMLIAMTTATAQEAKTIMSKLEEATVFFKGAELTYTANATVNKGDNELLIEGLSPNVDKNSLKIKTTNNVVVSSFEFSIDYLSATKAIAPTLKKIEDSISVFQSALDKVIIDIKVNTNMITQLQEGIKKNISGSEKGLGIDELMKAMDYYKSKSEVLEMNQVTYNQKKRQIEESIQKLRAHLNQESGKGNKTSGVLKLKVTALTATPTKLTISYYTPSATWSPYYDINITSTDKPVAIILKSKVVQTTGIDWEKITLHLSTATPSNGKIAPLFSVWFLAPLRPIPVAREMKMAMQNSYSYDVQASYAIVEEMEVADMASPITMDDYVKATEQAMNVVYSIDLPYTIPGNGKEQNIELQRKEAAAEYKYYCAPKLDSETYLLAELLDREKLELLSAPANLTYDGTYLGDTYVNASSTQDKLSLTLGSDKRVTVKREKMQDFSTTRFLGNDVIQIFTYKLTVKNNQNKRVMMVLKDQYPISTQKSIEVTLLRKETTPWSTNNEEVGVLTWEGELAAGETKTYQISFSVKYPKDLNLNL